MTKKVPSRVIGYNGGKYMLYIDQYGARIWAKSRKELAQLAGGGRVNKMYRDKKDGSTVHVGYVVGKRWFTCYVPYEQFAQGIMRAI